MATEKQISANQQNAKHSTGPTSQAGFDAIARNNFRHGLAGGGGHSHETFDFLDDEDEEKFQELYKHFANAHSPQNETEVILIRRMTASEWLRARALRFQTACLRARTIEEQSKLALFIRYQTAHERSFHQALKDLQSLREQRHKAEIGFESQKRKQATENRAAEALNVKKDAQILKREEFEFKKATAEMKKEAPPAAKNSPGGFEMAA